MAYLPPWAGGTPRWSHSPATVFTATAIAAEGDWLISGTTNGRVQYYRQVSASPIWIHTLGGFDYVRAVAINANGSFAVAGTHHGWVLAFGNGSAPLWTYNVAGAVKGLALVDGGVAVGAGSAVQLLEFNGTLRWEYPTAGNVTALAAAGTVVAGDDAGQVYRLSPAGTLLWSNATGSAVTAVAAQGERLAAANGAGQLLLRSDAETEVWSDITGVVSVALDGAGDYLVAGGDRVTLFRAGDDAPLWAAPVEGGASAVALAADGNYLAAGTNAGHVLFFARESSAPLWNYTARSNIMAVAISPDAHLVVSSSWKLQLFRTWDDAYLADGACSEGEWRGNFTPPATAEAGLYLFRVRANGSAWLYDGAVEVLNRPPNATIVSISHEVITEGYRLTVTGGGSDPDSTLAGYRWRSDRDGVFCEAPFCDDVRLSVGNHSLYFAVRDSDGMWSAEVNATLTVKPPPVELRGVAAVDLARPRGFAVRGNLVAVASYLDGLRLLDLGNPADPQVVGELALPGYAYGVALAGDHAYVAAASGGLRVVNVSQPTAPVEVANLSSLYPYGVAVADGYAYVANGSGGLVVVDVHDPTAPAQVGNVSLPGNAWRVALAGNHAYVANFQGFCIVNISAPAAPELAGCYDTPGNAYEVAVADGYAYLADRDGLRTFVVRDPANATAVGFLATPDNALGVIVTRGLVLVGCNDAGVVAMGLGDPATPLLIDEHDTPGYASVLALVGRHLVVADDDAVQVVLVNRLPTATIAPGPDVVDEGTAAVRDGAGSDDDGELVAYRWRSDRDGEVGHAATLAAELSLGVHTLYFAVQDNDGGWSSEARATVRVNALPAARIDAAPEWALADEPTLLAGSGSDAEGALAGYRWHSDRDGELGGSANLTTSLSPGLHRLGFSVQDGDGAWSPEATWQLEVTLPPVATIAAIVPMPVERGASVALRGDPAWRFTSYYWHSDRDGELSTAPSFTTTSLSLGEHLISYRVRDSHGVWSANDTATLRVFARPVADAGLVMDGTVGQAVSFTGLGSDDDGTILLYEWNFDGDGVYDWNGTSGAATHIYRRAGVHYAVLRVTDDDGYSDTDTIAITIEAQERTTELPGGRLLALVALSLLLALAFALGALLLRDVPAAGVGREAEPEATAGPEPAEAEAEGEVGPETRAEADTEPATGPAPEDENPSSDE